MPLTLLLKTPDVFVNPHHSRVLSLKTRVAGDETSFLMACHSGVEAFVTLGIPEWPSSIKPMMACLGLRGCDFV